MWDSMAPMLALALANTLALTFLAFHFGLIATHKVFGPLIPLNRQLEELKSGKYDSRSKLRDGDELQELSEGLNHLAEALEDKKTAV